MGDHPSTEHIRARLPSPSKVRKEVTLVGGIDSKTSCTLHSTDCSKKQNQEVRTRNSRPHTKSFSFSHGAKTTTKHKNTVVTMLFHDRRQVEPVSLPPPLSSSLQPPFLVDGDGDHDILSSSSSSLLSVSTSIIVNDENCQRNESPSSSSSPRSVTDDKFTVVEFSTLRRHHNNNHLPKDLFTFITGDDSGGRPSSSSSSSSSPSLVLTISTDIVDQVEDDEPLPIGQGNERRNAMPQMMMTGSDKVPLPLVDDVSKSVVDDVVDEIDQLQRILDEDMMQLLQAQAQIAHFRVNVIQSILQMRHHQDQHNNFTKHVAASTTDAPLKNHDRMEVDDRWSAISSPRKMAQSASFSASRSPFSFSSQSLSSPLLSSSSSSFGSNTKTKKSVRFVLANAAA
jgi:hypothetical protein